MVLGIDYGRKRMGLAISDETETIAIAINAIKIKALDATLDYLKKLVNLNKVSKILVGLPLGIDNKPTKMSNEINGFTKLLKKGIELEIIFWNETSTSEIAKTNIIKSKGIDSESARIILQEYLDFKRNKLT